MTWTPHPRHREEYLRDGVTIFRRIVPPELVCALRETADAARSLARAQQGAQAQRLQPLERDDLDRAALAAFTTLPAIASAVADVLGPGFSHSAGLQHAGILLEPQERPWCTNWHRDWAHHGIDRGCWLARFADERYFNQVNCALYQDASLWIVPGSNRRSDDLPEELAAQAAPRDTEGVDAVTAERRTLDYARGMPGARQVNLEPGDFALYRNTIWHMGAYVPYQRRATLHDTVDTPEFLAWREERHAERRAAQQAPAPAAG